MADSAVVITAGTGTNIDTRTEATNGNHRQVVVIGDPSTNAGVAPVDGTAGLKVDLGADNDITLATLPDTSGGDLAAINTNTSDVATQTTLALIKAKTDNLDTALSGIKTGTDKIIAAPATAAKQPALGTAGTASADVITIQGIASMTAVKVDGSGVTQPVSAASLPLPTGAATAANQQTDALTDTQLRASAVPVSLASVPSHAVTNAGTFAVQATETDGANATLGAKADAKSTATDTTAVSVMSVLKEISYMEQNPASRAVTNAGTFATQATLQSGSALVGKVGIDQTTPGTTNRVDVGTVNSVAPAFGSGARGATVQRVTIATDDSVPVTGTFWQSTQPVSLASVPSHAVTNAGTFAVQESGSHVQADDAAFTPATSKVMMAGFEADESSTDSVDEGDGGAARMTLDRKQIVTLQPHTSGGLSTFMASGSDGSSILVATAQAVKASAGQLYGYYAYNPEAAVTFVHFYNTAAASVTVGTTNPLFTIAIPAGSAANLSIPQGITFSNAGWSVAATTTAGGNTAPATGVSLVAWYM